MLRLPRSRRAPGDTENAMHPPYVAALVVAALALAQGFYYYPLLPDVVASHFDGAGRPNGWSTKAQFFGLYFGIMSRSWLSG